MRGIGIVEARLAAGELGAGVGSILSVWGIRTTV